MRLLALLVVPDAREDLLDRQIGALDQVPEPVHAPPHVSQLFFGGLDPLPTVKPGATPARRSSWQLTMRFNPHPTVKPGATQADGVDARELEFQSSPDREAGCNENDQDDQDHHTEFQSSPDREAGCNTSRP